MIWPSLVGSLCIGRTALSIWCSSLVLSSSTLRKVINHSCYRHNIPIILFHLHFSCLLSHGVILGQVEFLLGIVNEVVECHRVNICISAPCLVIVPVFCPIFVHFTSLKAVPCTAGESFAANNQLVIVHSNTGGHCSRKLELHVGGVGSCVVVVGPREVGNVIQHLQTNWEFFRHQIM